MTSSEFKNVSLPDVPGVYFFRDKKGAILYIGKATSLKNRVKSYFSKELIETRGPMILDMVFRSHTVTFTETDSVLEALILEAELIKRHQPPYNVKEKDNKSFLCVVITNETMPQVLTVRKKDIDFIHKVAFVERGKRTIPVDTVYGPFTNGTLLREALKIIRHIFPYRDMASSQKYGLQFYRELALSPLTPDEAVTTEYTHMIGRLKLFFEGKKKQIIRSLKTEMHACAQARAFERAGEIKRKLFALEHINDIALIKKESSEYTETDFRIEAYDVAHQSGTSMVGVMVVSRNGQMDTNEYRKFKIKTLTNSNDVGSLAEILTRRLLHTEWPLPSLLVVDGNTIQKQAAEKILLAHQTPIPVVAVVKDQHHKARTILGDHVLISKYKSAILSLNNEAHRFALSYHRTVRAKKFISH